MTELTLEQMKKLTTQRLLAYKKKIIGIAMFDPEDLVWKNIYSNVKAVLATREHVEKKKHGLR